MNMPQKPPAKVIPIPDRPMLRTYVKVLCIATLFLIFMGGLVKSHEAGLSVPDWPTTYGENMFLYPLSKLEGGQFYEHTHRLVASAIGFMTLVLCAWLAIVDRRVWLKMCGALALVAVVAQGVLGGLTVWYLLPAPISVAHGVLAQSFLVLLVFIAYALSRSRELRMYEANDAESPRVARWAIATTIVVWVQLVLGAVMRHTEAGLAIPDFPTMGGEWIPRFDAAMLASINEWRALHAIETGAHLPDVTVGQVVIHFIHRAWALVVLGAVAGLVWSARRPAPRNRPASTSAIGVAVLVAIQVLLGIFTVWTAKEPWITSFHVLCGAALLALSALCAFQAMPVRLRKSVANAPAPKARAAEATPIEARG